MYRIQTVTPATTLAVSVSEMKTYLGVSHSSHDTMIENLVRAAMRMAEDSTWVILTTTTFRMYMDDFRDTLIPRFPIQAIQSVQYYDVAGVLQTLAADQYYTDLDTAPCRIEFKTTPTTQGRLNAVRINFTAGHASVASINPGILQGIRMAVAQMYDNRSDTITTTSSTAGINSESLFGQFREFYIPYDASGRIR